MKEGGIGGFEVQAVYPLLPDDPSSGIKNLPYLSDEFIDALRFTSTKARELGLRMDLTLGSGWPYGGPSVPITDASGKLRLYVYFFLRSGRLLRLLVLLWFGDGHGLAYVTHFEAGEAADEDVLTQLADFAGDQLGNSDARLFHKRLIEQADLFIEL